MKFRYEFPPKVEAERAPVFEAIRRGLSAATPASVAEASRAQRAWLERYPDDYAMWDIGGTISLLADALEAESPAGTQREEAFQALERAMRERTAEAVQIGLMLARAWLVHRPDDWAMRDAGEPVVMLAEALEIVAREEREEEAQEEQARGRRDAPAVAA